ncbi:hypothetical protein BG842_11715 [Haladaptatus sp. W1]|nr:hypothetical protein BG842_11715 [Haladaptatus sp. W1]
MPRRPSPRGDLFLHLDDAKVAVHQVGRGSRGRYVVTAGVPGDVQRAVEGAPDDGGIDTARKRDREAVRRNRIETGLDGRSNRRNRAFFVLERRRVGEVPQSFVALPGSRVARRNRVGTSRSVGS